MPHCVQIVGVSLCAHILTFIIPSSVLKKVTKNRLKCPRNDNQTGKVVLEHPPKPHVLITIARLVLYGQPYYIVFYTKVMGITYHWNILYLILSKISTPLCDTSV